MNNEEIFEITTEGICVLLGVKCIKQIVRRGTLEQRLLEKNVKLVSKEKRGRNTIYNIMNLGPEKTFKELCLQHKIKKIDKFEQHTKNRYFSIKKENDLTTQQHFANKIEEDRRTIKKFDDVLLKEKFMVNDGYKYWVYQNGKVLYETSRESYNQYWATHRAEKRMIEILIEKYKKGELTLEEYSNMYANIFMQLNTKGEVIQRTRKFAKGSEFEKIFKMVNEL